ncbi:hypothetical protein [Streptomyces sp. ODS28]|uniref:hypothetical protein n=1 Tax=Streptomyces sp. ODS28 TaxID=3136688 RepID=UPI0031EF5D7D
MIPAPPATAWEDFEVPAHVRGGHDTLNLHGHLAAYVPQKPAAYLRTSSDRFGLEAGVDRQLEDAEDCRSRLGWGEFAKVHRENETSAFKKKVTKHKGGRPSPRPARRRERRRDPRPIRARRHMAHHP